MSTEKPLPAAPSPARSGGDVGTVREPPLQRGAREGPGAELATLALVTTTVFGIVLAITMVGPLLLDLGREFDISLGQAGLLTAAMALPWALGAPFAGLLSDR